MSNPELNIVIVEDDPIYQMLYMDALAIECAVQFCNSVSLAVSLSSLLTPDVFIVDLGLPDGDGITAIEELRKSAFMKDTVTIVVTASTNEARHKAAISSGANRVLIKPLEEGQLVAVIKSLVSQ